MSVFLNVRILAYLLLISLTSVASQECHSFYTTGSGILSSIANPKLWSDSVRLAVRSRDRAQLDWLMANLDRSSAKTEAESIELTTTAKLLGSNLSALITNQDDVLARLSPVKDKLKLLSKYELAGKNEKTLDSIINDVIELYFPISTTVNVISETQRLLYEKDKWYVWAKRALEAERQVVQANHTYYSRIMSELMNDLLETSGFESIFEQVATLAKQSRQKVEDLSSEIDELTTLHNRWEIYKSSNDFLRKGTLIGILNEPHSVSQETKNKILAAWSKKISYLPRLPTWVGPLEKSQIDIGIMLLDSEFWLAKVIYTESQHAQNAVVGTWSSLVKKKSLLNQFAKIETTLQLELDFLNALAASDPDEFKPHLAALYKNLRTLQDVLNSVGFKKDLEALNRSRRGELRSIGKKIEDQVNALVDLISGKIPGLELSFGPRYQPKEPRIKREEIADFFRELSQLPPSDSRWAKLAIVTRLEKRLTDGPSVQANADAIQLVNKLLEFVEDDLKYLPKNWTPMSYRSRADIQSFNLLRDVIARIKASKIVSDIGHPQNR